MNLCPTCTADLIPGAKYCHRCGDPVVEKTKDCPACRQANPLASVFCHHCGFHFEGARQAAYQPRYAIDFDVEQLTDQVKALFFRCLRQRVEEEHDIRKYHDFVDRFYQSGFKAVYEVRARQIGIDIMNRWNRFGDQALPDIDQFLDRSFDGLLDYFIIQFCSDLHGFVLPEAILRHEQAKPGKTDLHLLIRDYLAFDRENETIYADFIQMPAELLANACKSFLRAQPKEKVFFICDLSIKGSCKDGFALTDRGFYWKMPFDKPRFVAYHQIESVQKEKNWLNVNGQFFTVNSTMNLKMLKLLKKLRGWQSVEPVKQAMAH